MDTSETWGHRIFDMKDMFGSLSRWWRFWHLVVKKESFSFSCYTQPSDAEMNVYVKNMVIEEE